MTNKRKNVYVFYKNDAEIESKLKPLQKLAGESGYHIVDSPKKANIIISVGGDGAFLQAVRQTGFREDCLYTGIAISESPSLYCDFHIDDHKKIIGAMTNENIEVRRYPTIKVTVDNVSSFYCLNECTVRSSIIKTFAIDVFIDSLHFETFRGDGMIISAPTGSTAYNKSMNGAVVDPMLQCLQVTEIGSLNNNTYRTIGSPMILSGERTLKLKIIQDGNDYPVIGMDNEALSIRNVHELNFELTGKKIKTVKLKDNSFWEKVQRTFLS
jgi:NAD+ kinase